MKLNDLLNSNILGSYAIKVYNELHEELDMTTAIYKSNVKTINITMNPKTVFIIVDYLDYQDKELIKDLKQFDN